MDFIKIFAGVILLAIASTADSVTFDGSPNGYYTSDKISTVYDGLFVDYGSTLSPSGSGFDYSFYYTPSNDIKIKGNRIKILLLGGFYTHPAAPVLLLRCAEYFNKKKFDDIDETIEVHIVPIVNTGGYDAMINPLLKGDGYLESKINHIDGSEGSCPNGINIDRCFTLDNKVNEDCDEDMANNGNYNQMVEVNKLKMMLTQNFTFIFNFQSITNNLIIPYASNKDGLSGEPQFVYDKLSTKKVKYYKFYEDNYDGTFMDRAIDLGIYPIYVGLKDVDDYQDIKDFDDQCEDLRGNIKDLIRKPKGEINGIFEQKDGSEIVALYEFFNYLPSNCIVSFELKFYFNVNDQYELDECEIVQVDQLGYKKENKECNEDTFYSSEKINSVNYDTIGISSEDTIEKFTNYTIKFHFKRENSTDYSVKFLSKVSSLSDGIRFQTIVNNKTYDIQSFYSTPTKAPRWAIGIIMFAIFIVIVFTIVSCVMVKKRSNYFFRLLGQ